MGLNKINDIIKGKKENSNSGKAVVFFICLLLSSFLWLLNSLEKRYTDRISVPVKYINLPKDKQVSGPLPKKFDLLVDGYGYTLLSHKLRLAFSPVLLNVNDLTDKVLENGNISKITIYTSSHREEIAKQISSEINILSIKPDTISFNFSTIIEKKVKIKPIADLTFGKEFILKSAPSTNPDSVLVRGPKNILDTLQSISTKNFSYKELTHNIEKNISLESIEGLVFSHKRVSLLISVEQNTEVAFDIPIEVINHPDTIHVKTFPGKVKVSCRIGLSNYKKLTPSSFKAVADYSLYSKSVNRLPVSLVNYPDIVLSVNYAPREVEFIMEKNNE
jgi:hypothetical protein